MPSICYKLLAAVYKLLAYDDPIMEIAMPGHTMIGTGHRRQMYGMLVSPKSHCPPRVGGPLLNVSVEVVQR